MKARGLLGAIAIGLPIAACSVEWGQMPALCTDECPEGYECIQGVCATPGATVPSFVTQLGNLRAGDLRVIPQSDSVLVVWESYPYSDVGQRVSAKRLYADGSTSQELLLDGSWNADPGAVEPYYDVIAIDDEHLLLAMSSSPVDESDARPRIGVYSVELPSPGEDGDADSSFAWPNEVRMSTIGYGNVSQPRFVRADGSDEILLGYFEGVVDEELTSGRLEIFALAEDGSLLTDAMPCPVGDATCCVQPDCFLSERPEAVAAGVAGAFITGGRAGWVVDESRPSFLVTDGTDIAAADFALDDLAIPLAMEADALVALIPSQRTGEALPEGPVKGAATLVRYSLDTGDATVIEELPTLRDYPRPAWIPRADGGLLVTTGDAIDSPTLEVYEIGFDGSAELVREIERLSALTIGSVQAAEVDGKLYVVWLDVDDDRAVVRASVSDAP